MSKMNRRGFLGFLPKLGLGGFLLGKGLFQPEEVKESLVLEIEESEDPEVSETPVEPMYSFGASAMRVSLFPVVSSSAQWPGDVWRYDHSTGTYRYQG